ncbi:MAG: CHAD domain-containing protein [Microthrixaceae bacterium]
MAHRQPPDEVAIVAVAGVLRGYHDDARKALPGVLDGSAEDLHRFRISVRRARSVVAVSAGVMPEEPRVALRHSLRTIGRLSSPVRDLDVFTAELPDLAAQAVGKDPKGLAALVELAEAARQRPAVSLEWALRGPDGARLFEDWELASTSVPAGGVAPGALATDPALDVVDTWVWELFRSCRQKGREAVESDDLERWHDLRKSLKKLRYVLEAFDYLHDRKDLKAARRQLRRLQEHIGGLQDCRVQGELVNEMRERAIAGRVESASDLATEIHLDVARRLARIHAECTDAWQDFDTGDTKSVFKSLTAGRSA